MHFTSSLAIILSVLGILKLFMGLALLLMVQLLKEVDLFPLDALREVVQGSKLGEKMKF